MDAFAFLREAKSFGWSEFQEAAFPTSGGSGREDEEVALRAAKEEQWSDHGQRQPGFLGVQERSGQPNGGSL